ncbi:BREX-1 system adenine-specific DNA-methyltransferase PglX [Sporolactobacillus terrae]|uniref:site-specific DNA-methyltransferase (adenine-specific) n=1 Tax=Sporolactobacillus terrae TaxID=269673 RepID=A0A5K7WV93_9BACL|nr:BREX-1 system adenine-specific DNA-methyltransferase PglX [Sporolactobacillus terrae]BBN98182.1 class I SAM-dependent DNA methyltransferase [Sporolactobacillus terrae]
MMRAQKYSIDKAAVRKFAVSARKKLIDGVTLKGMTFGISMTNNFIPDPESVRLNGLPLDDIQKKQYKSLYRRINSSTIDSVIEEVAYTWFNRFIALRFMEVNDYLPTGIRIFSSVEEKKEPDMMSHIELVSAELHLDLNKVYGYQDRNEFDQLYKYLLIHQCNELNRMMPKIFEPIGDSSELLLPDNLLGADSVVREMVECIEEENWKHQVEIIGWLYQYYISEKKDKIFTELKKNVKISKENIPAATQLFTPRWIVQYMVENSLGRLWLEAHPSQELREKWSYYLDDVEQETDVQAKLDVLKNKNVVNPETIKVLDPCMGSGHVLVYAFDVLYALYKAAGYSVRDIPSLILQKNIYGLEIDERAKQLAYFSLVMKARHYDRQILKNIVDVHVYAICESNHITNEDINLVAEDKIDRVNIQGFVDLFRDAKLFGSFLKIPEAIDLLAIKTRLDELKHGDSHDLFIEAFQHQTLPLFEQLLEQARTLSMKYDVVITNPPYMGRKGMNAQLSSYVKSKYPDAQADLFAVMMERCFDFTCEQGMTSMITQQSWMFLSSFAKLRLKILKDQQINSMVHLGAHAFAEIGGEVVQNTMFVLRNQSIPKYKTHFIRLVDIKNAEEKSKHFWDRDLHYIRDQSGFSDIPGSPIAYWASDRVRKIFRENSKLIDCAKPRQGLATGDNDRFLRLWHEVCFKKIGLHIKNQIEVRQSTCKWFPISKGGSFRKWYGNKIYLVNWENDGQEIKNLRDNSGKLRARPQNTKYYFQKGITWSTVSSGSASFRYLSHSIFETKGSTLFVGKDINYESIFGYLNSKLVNLFLGCLSPTLDYHEGPMGKLPLPVFDKTLNLEKAVNENIILSKSDWDSFETSWDFKTHPFLEFRNGATTLEEAQSNWEKEAERRFRTVKANEEELNQIFINLYGLQNELDPEESDDEVTIRRADLERDVKSFLSYCVGIMFGRYSLDEDGLIYAGGTFNRNRYQTYIPDKDNVIPITDETYFEDDLVGRLIEILRLQFGIKKLDKNLDFIAEALAKKSTETARQRIRRYFLKEFYKEHVQTYKKRPIYWLFDSGKQNGFKALIYLHRYEPGLVARVRTDYLHTMERKYEDEMNRLAMQMEADVSAHEKMRVRKRKEKLQKQLEECRQYDQIIAHVANQQIPLDLDDGVKMNYAEFQKIEIPGKRYPENLLAKL